MAGSRLRPQFSGSPCVLWRGPSSLRGRKQRCREGRFFGGTEATPPPFREETLQIKADLGAHRSLGTPPALQSAPLGVP